MSGALGLIQVNGLSAAYAAADAALKSADITLLAMERVDGDALILLKFTGDVASVQAAVEVGLRVAKSVSDQAVGHVIARTAFPMADQKSTTQVQKSMFDKKKGKNSNAGPNSTVEIESDPQEAKELKGELENEQRTRNGRNKRVDSSN